MENPFPHPKTRLLKGIDFFLKNGNKRLNAR
uniref:Uncharacterized protein n=1 Tax=Myoviridae sp. ctOAa14 TaxID=2826646 RepID=A0A8S5MRQ5_9CAUD|nr:MAG TPA: hypothetical protein [Myoviridae sp. ctOAa14]